MPTRKEKELPTSFPSVVLYLNDIKDIRDIIEEETGKGALFSDEEYKYDSLDDLVKNRGTRIKSLSIESQHTGGCMVSFRAGGGFNRLSIMFADSAKERSIFHRITDIVHKQRRGVARLVLLTKMDEWWSFVYIAMTVAAFGASGYAKTSGYEWTATVLSFAVLGGVASLCIAVMAKFGQWSRVYLINPHEKPENIFRRNKDKIILVVISVILTLCVKAGWDAVWTKSDKAVQEQPKDNAK